MDEVGQVPNLERRGAVYRCRMRCPQHLLREGIALEKSVSLRTKERAIALERLPAARTELMAYFRGETKPAASSLSGIVPSVRRLQRPDHPDLPLLSDHELEAFARRFFSEAWIQLDRATASNFDLRPDEMEQRQIELEDRLADLEQASDDIEDPALAAEIAVLRKVGRRSPYNSGPSRLLRGYLRRALVQLCRIELARLSGDYRDEVTDSLYLAPTLYFFKLTNPTAENAERYPQKNFDVTKRRRWLKTSGGIRLYRDNFRVRPYGEPNSTTYDWLLLGDRVARNPAAASRIGWRVPPTQVAGTLHITKDGNPDLADQSSREWTQPFRGPGCSKAYLPQLTHSEGPHNVPCPSF